MRKFFKTLIALCTVSSIAMAYDNTPPIPERQLAWYDGKGRQMIEIDVYYDLTCSASKAFHPEFVKFLNMPFLTSTVRDAVKVNYNFLPLPYHQDSWIPHKILPYIIDQCVINGLSCKFPQYVQYAFDNQNTILSATDKSYNYLVDKWCSMVSQSFGWPKQDLVNLFNIDTDTHNSEQRVREMFKSSTHFGIFATPSAAVNGVLIQNVPFTADDWMKLLSDTYNAQT